MKTLLLALSLAFASPLHAETFQGGKIVYSFASTVTAAGTTTLTSSSASQQDFTGTSAQTVVLPDATTLKNGMNYWISNDSTGTLTIQYSGGGAATTLLQNEFANFFLQANGTAAGTWDMQKVGAPTVTGTANRAAIFNGSGILAASSVTDTTLAFMDATSSVQTQINSKITAGAAAIVNADVSATAAIARSKLASGTANHVLINDGSGVSSSEANLAVSRGGTGLGTLTANNVILGNGTSTPTFVAPSTSGNVLTSNGTTWTSAAAAASGGGGIYAGGQNLIANNSFETNTTGWTSTATGTGCAGSTGFARTTTAGQYIPPGSAGACFDSAATGETLIPTSVTITSGDGLSGRNGVASCSLRANSGTSTITLTADDGTNDLATAQTMTSSTSAFQRTSVNFIFPASGTVRLKLKSVASNEPVVYLDDCYFGLAEGFNVQQVSQANIAGHSHFPSTASCTWTRTNTALGSFTTVAACPGPTVDDGSIGTWATTDSDLPKQTISNLPPGKYKATFVFEGGTNTNQNTTNFQIYDGATSDGQLSFYPFGLESANGGYPIVLVGYFNYTTAGTHDFEIRAAAAGTATAVIENSRTGGNVQFYLERFPLTSETAYRPDSQNNWKVDAYISGSDPSLGVTTVASYTEITNASLTLANGTGPGTLSAQIPCSTTNPSTGTTCAAGNESVGASFTPTGSFPQDVEACATFLHYVNSTTSLSMDASFRWVETPSSAQTILQSGALEARWYSAQTGERSAPLKVCSTFTLSAPGQRTFRLFEKQTASGTFSSSSVLASSGATILLSVRPVVNSVQAPVLVGSVTSNSSGAERMERAKVVATSAGACSVVSQSGSWIASTSPTAAGDCTLNLAAGMFSAEPTCTITPDGAGGTSTYTGHFYSLSTSAIRFVTKVDTGTPALAAVQASIHCMGPK